MASQNQETLVEPTDMNGIPWLRLDVAMDVGPAKSDHQVGEREKEPQPVDRRAIRCGRRGSHPAAG